jgi:HlyD family secretion protein
LRELQQRIDTTVRERGMLTASSIQDVLAPLETTIVKLAREGQTVQAGDVIVELDAGSLQDQLPPVEIELAGKQATAQLVERTIECLEKQRALATRVAAQRSRVAELKREAFAAQQRANPLPDATARATEAELQLAAIEAELSGLQLQQSIDERLTQSQAELQAARVALRLLSNQLARLQRQIDACVVRARDVGTLVYASDSGRRTDPVVIEEGAQVRERQLIGTVFSPKNVKLEVRVHESRIAQVRLGQPARIRFDALPEELFTGAVSFISPTASAGQWPNFDHKEYVVEVKFTNPPEELQPLRLGLTAYVEIDASR